MKKLLQLLFILLFITCTCYTGKGQVDSTLQNLQHLPSKYISQIDAKIEKYSSRITSKTEKTLTKLSRWENKIHNILQKISPEADQKLFGNNQLTLSTLLQKYKKVKAVAENYKAKYDEYRDKLTTSLKYIDEQKDKVNKNVLQPISEAKKKLNKLEEEIANTESVEQFIKERRKQLIDEAIKHIGKSKYLTKINKEAYYYVETLRNYKEIFSDSKKAEETALNLLNKIPAFKKFINENSALAGIFKMPGSSFNTNAAPTLAGIQTRTNVEQMIQTSIAVGGPNAISQVQQQIQTGQAELGKLRDKISQYGSADADIPSFNPNQQKTKTFLQRLEYGANIQFGKANQFMPSSSDVALFAGYKINDKSAIGIGASYRMGLGSGWNNIQFTSQGIGLRSYIDWKIKGNFFVSGGYEQNYNSQFKNIQQLKDYSGWQSSGLIGISKKLQLKGGKAGKIQILYDFLNRTHIPVTPAFVFRTGFTLK